MILKNREAAQIISSLDKCKILMDFVEWQSVLRKEKSQVKLKNIL